MTNSDGYYLTDFTHMLITGSTGSGSEYGGKSVLSGWIADNSVKSGFVDISIIFNVKGHDFFPGEKCYSIKDVVTSYNSGNKIINYIPDETPIAEHSRLVEVFKKVSGRKLFVHDEAHMLSDSPELDWCFRQGGNVGSKYRTGNIRSIAVTQHPWDLKNSTLNNTPLIVWIGPKTAQAKRYFQTMQIESAYKQIPENIEPYHWAVIDAGEFVEINAPVPQKYAN